MDIEKQIVTYLLAEDQKTKNFIIRNNTELAYS